MSKDTSLILIVGYYGRCNYGDEAFITTLSSQWSKASLTFHDLESVPAAAVEKADLIVLGGGDVLQDYFLSYIEKRIVPYKKCPLYAVGVSMPYRNIMDTGRLDVFDAFWCRCKEDVELLQKRYGDKSVFSIPDLALLNPIPVPKLKKTGRSIGLAISMSLVRGPCKEELLQQLRNLIHRLLTMGYNLYWLAFNTDSAEHESDVALYRLLPAVLQRQIPLFTTRELIPTLVEMDLVIASRFHAHVFSSLAAVPVVSLQLTRKVAQWNKDHGWSGVVLPRQCQWCKGEGGCPSCAAYVGWITSLPIGEICNAVRRKGRSNYNTKKDIMLLKVVLADVLEMDWAGRGTPPYYIPPNSTSLLLSTLSPSWRKFADREVSAETLAASICLKVTGNPRHSFYYGLLKQLQEKGKEFDLRSSLEYMVKTSSGEEDWSRTLVSQPKGKFSLNKIPQHRLVGMHRAGWAYVVDKMSALHNADGIIMDTFLDRTFGWDSDFYQELGILPYKEAWTGFLHHPPKAVFSDNDCSKIVENILWKESLPYCKALFVMATDLKDWLQGWLQKEGLDIPIHVLYHPTDEKVPSFTWEKFKREERRVVQIGAWLRDPYAMFQLRLPSHCNLQKTVLKCKDMAGYITTEAPIILPAVYKEVEKSDLPIMGCRDGSALHPFLLSVQASLQEQWRSVEVLEHVSDAEYDELLTCNVVLLPLLKAEAVNTVLDCMVRNTPVIVSKLPAVIEYLGASYPGYFEDYREAERKIGDEEVLLQCHKYLLGMDKTFLTVEYFLTHLETSLTY